MNPETDTAPYFQEFTIDVAPSDRILDVLLLVKNTFDSTLAVRKSCAHGVCGSDAMIINGVECLACKTLVKDVATEENATVSVEPLKSLPVQRDLMVDQKAFFDKYISVNPFLMRKDVPKSGEIIQTPAEHAKFDDPTKCILCGSCYSACPIVEHKNPDFIGPAASIQAARFVFDSRDTDTQNRLAALDTPNGVSACDNHFNCTKVCPRGIKITKLINETKRALKASKT